MATITITTPSDKDARIAAAYDAQFPGRPNGTTQAQWIKAQIILSIRQVVIRQESFTASSSDTQTVASDVGTFDIS